MQRGEENARIFLGQALRAIAVVHVDINNGDAFEPVHVEGMTGTDGDGIEQAEAHGPVRLGVMARRPGQAEGMCRLAGHDPVNRFNHTARRMQPSRRGTLRHLGIGIQRRPLALLHRRHSAENALDMRGCVKALELAANSRPAVEPDGLLNALQRRTGRVIAPGMLGMTRRDGMPRTGRAIDDQGRHGASASG